MFKFKAEEKGISLKFEDSDFFPLSIYTDGGRLQQILVNLISNSLKYTKTGYIKVINEIDSENSLIKITV